MLQKSRFLTPGKFTSKNKKKGLVETPFFLSSLLLCLCSILSQLSWARTLWTLNPVKVLGSPWISGSFWRGRRWGLETQMQIFQVQKRESWISGVPNLHGSRCGTPAPVIVLSLSGLKTFAKWREVPSFSHHACMSCTLSGVGWWEWPGAAQDCAPGCRSRETWGC